MAPFVAAMIPKLVSPLAKLIDDLHTSPEEKMKIQQEMKAMENKLMSKVLDNEREMVKAQAKIIEGEGKGGWLQRNWRPILMMVIVTIIANNYLIAPYLNVMPWFAGKIPILELPEKLYTLMTIGVGGYIAGRSAEKIVPKMGGK